ncbi:hypothetical protein [Glutamicibacter sp. Je.9.36]|uniref:hypothetical protein n=1 Tax=Glutamicibacter sp. Je.9.36 TaxID=3142837 RepID=UPI003DA7AC7C
MRPKLIALLAVPVFALFGCSAAKSTPEPTATVTVTATPSASAENSNDAEPTLAVPEESLSPEENYLNGARMSDHSLSKMTDKELLKLAEQSCERLAEGEKIPEVITAGSETKRLSANMAVRNMAGSQLCPDNL